MMTTKELSYKVMTNAHMVLWTRCAKNGGNVHNKNSTKGYHRARHNKDAIMFDRKCSLYHKYKIKQDMIII